MLKNFLLLVVTFFAANVYAADANVWPKDYMVVGEHMAVNQYMRSHNGAFFAILLPNGAFAVYKGSSPAEEYGLLWNTDHTVPDKAYFAQINEDGNFSVWRGTSPSDNRGVMWHSNVMKEKGKPYFLIIQDDGNLVVYKGTGPTNNQGLVWGSMHTSPVHWLTDGHYLRNESLGDSGYLYLGYFPVGVDYGKEWSLWLYKHQSAQRWGFQPDGTLRWGPDADKCLSFAPTHENQYWGWYLSLLVLETCNGSEIQRGWYYDHKDLTLRNKMYPHGCVFAQDVYGAGWMTATMNTETCSDRRKRWVVEP